MTGDHLPAGSTGRPHVVVVGAGFGGLTATQSLRHAPVDVTVVDRRNYHLFQPLLYQVATAGLSPADIAAPIRGILGSQRNATVLLGKVTDIDRASRAILLDTQQRVPFDYLVVATGARHAYFGRDEWADVAPGLKKIEDATSIRRRLLLAFEQAETIADAVEQRRLLSFVVVGGGPTGVELAGAIAELAKKALAKDFRRIDPRSAHVILIEAGPRLLSAFPESLSAKAKRALENLGVEVLLGQAVSACDAGGVTVGNHRIEARTIVWGAGVAASAAAKWLKAAHDRVGRVEVSPDLSLPGSCEIFVIGDTAKVVDAAGKPVPGIAPAAKQQGRYVAQVINARVRSRAAPPPFRYRHLGNLATIGRKAAVVDFGRLRLSGQIAWLLWGMAHLFFLIGFRNRFAVLIDWLWSYITYGRGSRLIVGSNHQAQPIGVDRGRQA
ncbi:NAD(P)/FAD-dependent oxidoreductase [Vineibacter terrae]|uniref:NAD(P)/FAD-dependent oxidoreductase n=1 Tax=Vineibacter terrae TaxID=2586908 RepID=UPI002E313A10|nr:NAD(P)/FAD-dependent oxidoreductase [Vineibacter terrae]HEX2891426.1 NAD(P)/FAD-dependent oxidoreductase [Vineibacter terrae]